MPSLPLALEIAYTTSDLLLGRSLWHGIDCCFLSVSAQAHCPLFSTATPVHPAPWGHLRILFASISAYRINRECSFKKMDHNSNLFWSFQLYKDVSLGICYGTTSTRHPANAAEPKIICETILSRSSRQRKLFRIKESQHLHRPCFWQLNVLHLLHKANFADSYHEVAK